MTAEAGEQRLVVEAHLAQLARVRRFTEQVLASFPDLSDGDCYQIKMAVNEAVSNAIEHGTPCPGGVVHLRCANEDGELAFYVEDCGNLVLGTREEDALAERGRGLAVMNLLMDQCTLDNRDDGTVVRLAKRIAG